MKVTFPHMGPVLAYGKLFEKLGHEVIMPPRPTAHTVALGVKHSPEFICFPFKIILGSYLEAVAQGAELIVTSGGVGACRAGYFGALSEKILRNLGYDVRVLVFDSIFEDFPGFYRQLQTLTNQRSLPRFLSALQLTIHMVWALDKYEKRLNRVRPYEMIPGACNQSWREIQRLIGGSDNLRELWLRMKQADALIAAIDREPRSDILKVGLVGEIYLVMEGSMNHELETRLAALGAEAVRYRYISSWLKHCLFPPRSIFRKADRYLKYSIGGHERENIGQIVAYKEQGFDGIIHVMPFGCMPELVTQTIIPTLSEELDLPILSLSLDEQAGWVNSQVRLEAFIELLRNRKELAKEGHDGQRIFGS
ncbi:putative nucleotide-binding protein (sugar kinase/HSP70/actin superfamily) [Hydrogenispora ethanolica]|uniref:Putative nucleotide-binding protein (Sugar kinase/HSP70/actin superfamily) n=1 Tax=Hydrogenispora ethanolica TaxID=1082276 RepID=A0A4R1S208_HYDET|nr:hypothetical protein [Hydrogenispora ethanolica]TCL73198.1 putative nucleotide-binding protein (sugar kinase/HSP70/actin superfamily) [Hydrogenispora ethanolica]